MKVCTRFHSHARTSTPVKHVFHSQSRSAASRLRDGELVTMAISTRHLDAHSALRFNTTARFNIATYHCSVLKHCGLFASNSLFDIVEICIHQKSNITNNFNRRKSGRVKATAYTPTERRQHDQEEGEAFSQPSHKITLNTKRLTIETTKTERSISTTSG